MSIGKIAEFNMHKDDWKLYVERLEQYFVVNKIPADLNVPTLITVMGAESYELLVNLCTPDKPKTKTFEQLSEIMCKHLQPKPSELAERYKFRHRKQKEGETISDYVAVLKKMSKTCDFGSWLEESLRDQLVCGIASENIRQRLFAELKLDFAKAYKLAASMESAEKDAAVVEGPKSAVERGAATVTCQAMAVRRPASGVAERGGQPSVSRRDAREHRDVRERPAGRESTMAVPGERARLAERARPQRPCRVCGANHNESSCKFAHYVCRVCNRQGHLRRVCPKLVSQYQMDVQTADRDEETDSDEVIFVDVCRLSISSCKPIYITLNVHNKEIAMECDTGSAESCISRECYDKLFNDLSLQPCKLTLRYYTGETVKPLGLIRPLVRYKDRSEFLELIVIEKGKTVLLGRHWIAALNIQLPDLSYYNVHNMLDNNDFDVSSLSSKYCNVFAEGLGRFTGGAVSIHVREGARPVFMRARPLAYALREPVERTLDQLVRDGVLTPVERSDWATPIVPVVKKDGTIRICADYKLTLNKVIEIDRYPLPKVEDLLFRLRGGEYYSKIDLSQAYAQFELDDTKKYTVINTHKGLYMYNRLVFGLASSPGIFQRRIEQIFADMPRVGVFLDDIIVTGNTKADHTNNLHKVLQRLQDYGLKVKKEKCVFFSKSVSYLGHIISKDGVHTCPDKIRAVMETPAPTNVTELRAFIGLVMYYAKFIKNVSTVLAPLYNLLRSGAKYTWSEDCESAFVRVKRLLASGEVLTYYNPELPLVLTTDASSVGVGAVISHVTADGERPVAYASRSLTPTERAYAQIDREALGIVFGIRKFHQYLYGRHFLLRTDHKPLTYIFGNKTGIPVMAASRLQRWAVLLSGYNYDIEYIASSKNSADALSRLPYREYNPGRLKTENTYVNFVENFLPVTSSDIKRMISKDTILGRVMLYIQSGWPSVCSNNEEIKPFFARRNELYVECGCIMWGYRMVIPHLLRGQILNQLHSSHMGIVKMKSLARSYVWWPNIDKDIEALCKRCETCAAEASAPPRATIQPWPYCTQPWTRLHIDFLGPYRGMTFLVLIDSSTKWLEIFEMPRTNAFNVIKVLRSTFARYGLPEQLVSDQGPPFTSIEFKQFLSNNGIRQNFSPAYHPSSNGAAENAVNICKRTIKKAIRDRVDVDTALQTFLLAYRNTVHSTTGETPAMLLQKRTLRSRLDLLRTERAVGARVQDAQQRQIESSGGVSRVFDEGDHVWMRNYGSSDKWVKGTISDVDSARRYLIARDNGQFIKRHVDQLRRRSRASVGVPNTEEEETIEDEDSVAHAGDNLLNSGENEDGCSDNVCKGSKSEQPINSELGGVEHDQPSNQSGGSSAQQQQEYPKRTRKPVIRFQCT